jgi:predicted nicotinamide N-methyase
MQPATALYLQQLPPIVVVRTYAHLAHGGDCGDWWSVESQQRFRSSVLYIPVAVRYAPPVRFIAAVVKTFLAEAEAAAGEAWECDEDLIEDHLALMAGQPLVRRAAAAQPQATQATVPHREDEDFFFKTFLLPPSYCRSSDDDTGEWPALTLRVASQFSNVGLSLWASAFVLVDWLRNHLSVSDVLPVGQLRMLELGSGVGLTACALSVLGCDADRIERLVMTDYQPAVLDNCRGNAAIAEACGGAHAAHVASVTSVELLDWTEHKRNESLFAEWGCNVIVAADVTYDRSVVQPLAVTIVDALRAVQGSVCVVVATHRNAATVDEFLREVQPHCSCQMMTADPVGHPAVAEPLAIAMQQSNRQHRFAGGLCGPFAVDFSELLYLHVLRLRDESQ